MIDEVIEYSKKILEIRKYCAENGDCTGCRYLEFCTTKDLAGETTKVIKSLIAYFENER